MIIDKLENFKQYSLGSINLQKAIEFLTTNNFKNYKEGSYPLNGQHLFYIINKYKTKHSDSNELEFHKRYIDLHFITNGCEIIKHQVYNKHKISKTYNSENDLGMAIANEYNQILLTEGMCAIFYPDDLHMPGFSFKNDTFIKKIVVKIEI